MRRGSRPDVLRHSVLDRLAGTSRPDPSGDLRIGIEDLRQVVRRDLEWILNARRFLQFDKRSHPESARSILAYGLPDLCSYSRSSEEDRQEICQLIESAILAFEPRIEPDTLQVTAVQSTDPVDFRLHFHIEGVIRVEPIREPVSFDTSVDPSTGALSVGESADA